MSNFVATFEWVVANDHHKLLRPFLREECQLSKRGLAHIKFNGGMIMVNGHEATVRSPLQCGDVVTVGLPLEKRSESLDVEHIPLSIIYEDDHFIVVDKVAGMLTIPSREHPNGTLANAILGYYERIGLPTTFHAVNRLDRDTSGLLIIAKHRFAHDRMSDLQNKGKVKRYYQALVHDRVHPPNGTVDAPIGRADDSIITRMVTENGKKAVTHYHTLTQKRNYSLLSIQLETGRTHQIRVHFAYLGHPLLGDDLYGGKRDYISRQALHCNKIEFTHPFIKETVTITSELPKDMKQLL
ncbi:RluA family pseudouridine synthase [Halalkalibacter hemicellulosilyticus]|uniref:Pseudouridine synthase n=1 Tax=Halalkalibacter hemicellulosilyticusJCM 9152 TaxID=1236971 RepID=W4QMV1_9BACI|nr:RluA family pseudouridine synthase [Halalkalibacter hemicellulosilyticus]GAE32684.1 pseudouridine synthase D [Halalkalibacter hemicellulosilyticusJCM 9152]